MSAENFRELMDDVANRELVLELVDRYVNRDIKWQIIEAYNEAIANPPMQELRGELVAIKDGIAQVKILDPIPNVTGSFRVVVDGGLAGAEGAVFSGSKETTSFTDQNIEQLLDLIRPKHSNASDWNDLRQWVLDAYHNKPIECEPFERTTVNGMVALVRSAEKELFEHGLTFDQWLAKYGEAVRSMF